MVVMSYTVTVESNITGKTGHSVVVLKSSDSEDDIEKFYSAVRDCLNRIALGDDYYDGKEYRE